MTAKAGRPVCIALDCMGGDNAPGEVVSGAVEALGALPDVKLLLVGDPARMQAPSDPRLTVVEAQQVIGMDEHPAQAVRAKPDASIPVAVRQVKEGAAEAVVSAGNTGAMMASSMLILGRIKGVKRPAIAAVIPTRSRPMVMLDVGATADCKPEHLLQFAHMGVAFAETVLGLDEPTVGLLNIGEEAEKGSSLTQEAHQLLAATKLRFEGNVEGGHMPEGPVDVLVADGFSGNVALKVLEGTVEAVFAEMKGVFTSSPRGKLSGLLAKPMLGQIKDRYDYAEHGGAPLLGVKGVSIIAHGRSDSKAIANAVKAAYRAVDGALTDRIARALMEDAEAPR